MTDKQLFALIMTALGPQMPAGVLLARNYQATQQGANSGPYVYFTKVSDLRYGHTARKDRLNEAETEFIHEETQVYQTTLQFTAWVPDTATATESDILNIVAGLVQSDRTIGAFLAAGASLLRVTDVRNPSDWNDHDRYQAAPSFDVAVGHTRVVTTTTPIINTYDARLRRV